MLNFVQQVESDNIFIDFFGGGGQRIWLDMLKLFAN